MRKITARATVPPTTRPPARRPPPLAVRAAAPAPTHEQVARRAYEIYLSRRHGEGDAMSDWLAAERELQAEARVRRVRARRQPPGPAPAS